MDLEVHTIGELCRIIPVPGVTDTARGMKSFRIELARGIYPYFGIENHPDGVDDYNLDGNYVLIEREQRCLTTRGTFNAIACSGGLFADDSFIIMRCTDQGTSQLLAYLLQQTEAVSHTVSLRPPLRTLREKELTQVKVLWPTNHEQLRDILFLILRAQEIPERHILLCESLLGYGDALFAVLQSTDGTNQSVPLGSFCLPLTGRPDPPSSDSPKRQIAVVSSFGISGSCGQALTDSDVVSIGLSGNPGAVHYSADPVWVFSDCCYIDASSSSYPSPFLYFLFRSLFKDKERNPFLVGSNIDSRALLSHLVKLPSDDRITGFAHTAALIIRKLELLDRIESTQEEFLGVLRRTLIID